MKTSILVLTLALAGVQVQAQFVVVAHTPDLDKITIDNHVVEIGKLVALIEQMTTTKDWLGNAAQIVDIAGATGVLENLKTDGVAKSRLELAMNATSQNALSYDGAGLFVAPEEFFTSRDGHQVARADNYKPQAAVFRAVLDFDAVHEDVKVRRKTLRGSMQQTVRQLEAATTHAEVQKATGVLLAQQAELQSTDHELDVAIQKAVLLDLQNRAAREVEEKARAQEQAQEFGEAVDRFTRMLRLPDFTKPRTK